MKKIIAGLLIAALTFSLSSVPAFALVHVKGFYSPKRSTYVAPYYRTSPDRTRLNNYSTKGNVNPFTGKKGYKSPYSYKIYR
jgi:hypothetical protein